MSNGLNEQIDNAKRSKRIMSWPEYWHMLEHERELEHERNRRYYINTLTIQIANLVTLIIVIMYLLFFK